MVLTGTVALLAGLLDTRLSSAITTKTEFWLKIFFVVIDGLAIVRRVE